MVDAVVSAVLEQLTYILRQQVEERVRLVVGVDEEIKALCSNLQTIQDVLKDAEKRQVKEHAVRGWLEKLKNIAYDMEDVLDDWRTAIEKIRAEEGNSNNLPQKKVRSSIPLLSSCFKQISHVARRYDISKEIKDIKKRLDEIIKEKCLFSFEITGRAGELELERRTTTSLVNVNEVHGRDAEKKELISKLVPSTNQEEEPQIVALQGPGGIGKTTLAKLAYNDKEVEKHFSKRLWVCVSSPFDRIRVAKDILKAFNGAAQDSSLDTLLQEIHNRVTGDTFLLVLDDIWTDKREDWEDLWLSLKSASPRSRILVTTRKMEVAKMMRAMSTLSVEVLSEDQCWLLFKKHAIFGRTDAECQKLDDIGRQISRKCKGLPLAAKTLGGFMRDKKSDIQQWETVLRSPIWELEASQELGMFPYLLLSYHDLPSQVKRCFSFCAIFPKDYDISRDELIQLWMAQGYLSSRGDKDMEVTGEEYFHVLAMRSFFQNFDKDFSGAIRKCKMHDIVHDFALFLTKNETLTLDIDAVTENGVDSFGETARHVTLTSTGSSHLPSSIYNAKKVRTLFLDGTSYQQFDVAALEMLQHSKCLRAFHHPTNYVICPSGKVQVPRVIKDFKHLRFLNLSRNAGLEELPDIICDLHNLQTLNLRGCIKLKRLPQRIGKLVKLRHLDVRVTALEFLPRGIKDLRCLLTLTLFKVCRDNNVQACNLGDLRYLTHLGGSLCIDGLGHTGNKFEFKNNRNLLSLELRFSNKDGNNDADIINGSQPPPALKVLKLYAYKGSPTLPGWMMCLVELEVAASNSWETLPALGKSSSLERLRIACVGKVRKVGTEFLGKTENDLDGGSVAFPKLKELSFSKMDSWEEWEEENGNIKIMPSLTRFEIFWCKSLKSLPSFLSRTPLQCLVVHNCPRLVGEKEKFSHISTVVLT